MRRNYIYILFAGALWGTTGIFTNILGAYFGCSAHEICSLKMIMTAVILGVCLLIFDRSAFKIRPVDIWKFLGSGVLGHCLFTYFYYMSIEKNGMAVGAVLLYTSPIFVTVMSAVCFRSRITPYKIAAIAMSVLGCALVSGVLSNSVGDITVFGIVIGIAAGIGYSLYTIFSRFSLNSGYSSATVSFYTFLFASLASIPISGFSGGIVPKTEKSMVLLVLFVVVLAAVTGVLPYFMYNKGLRKVDPTVAAILASVEPVVASLVGIFIFKEKVNLTSGIGMLLVIMSIVVGSLGELKKQKNDTVCA